MKPVANRALLVGAFTAVIGIASLVAITFVRKGGYSERDTYGVYAYFSDATGLTWKSRVQIAGIQIGEVDGIKLSGPRARLEIRVKKEVELHKDACFTRTFPSALLADAVIDVFPGSPDSPKLEDLPEGEREVTCVRSSATVQEVMNVMNGVATDVRTVTSDLARTVTGNEGSLSEIIRNLAKVSAQINQVFADNSGNLSQILSNTRSFTGDLARVSARDRETFHEIAVNVEDLTFRLRRVAASLEGLLGPPPGSLGPERAGAQPGVSQPGASPAGRGIPQTPEEASRQQNIRDAIDRLSASAAKLDDILAKVKEGKSVVGELLVDERLGRKVGDTIETATDYVDRLQKLQIQMQMRSELPFRESIDAGQPEAKIYLGARILPRPDKFYLFELVSDPRGATSVSTNTISTQLPGSTSQSSSIVTQTVSAQSLTYSLEFGKRYGPATFRVGIIEGSGGLGSDFHLMDDKLELSLNLFQFDRPYANIWPRAKAWGNYYFLQNFYVTGGLDDFLNKARSANLPGSQKFYIGNDLFLGAGFYFTDDDVKTLLISGAGSALRAQ